MPDFKAGDTVTVDRRNGVAWRVLRHSTIEVYDGDPRFDEPFIEDVDDWFVCVMVGDDREEEFDQDDLTLLDEDGYCPGCGQTGCGHYR